jgi:hypothetical protein
MIDIEEYLTQEGIRHTTEHHHSTRGWVQIELCPFCESKKYHLGYNIRKQHFHCWKCGGHTLWDTLIAFGSDPKVVKEEFQTDRVIGKIKSSKNVFKVKIPHYFMPINDRHRKYLKKRKYDPDTIEMLYKIRGTDHLAPQNWRSRIIIPIYFQNKLVSFQGRAIVKKRIPKYMSLENNKAVMDLKNTLYGLDDFSSDRVVVTEGVMDVWRLGPGAVCTYGTSITAQQTKLLLSFEQIFLLFDNEKKAQERADKIISTMSMFGKKVENISRMIKTDPGDLKEEEAEELMNLVWTK